jgi:hypothetical protein
MRTTLFFSGFAALALATTLNAQPAAGRSADRETRRERLAERREQFKNMTPEERDAAKAKLAERRDTRLEKASPEMRTWLTARQEQARAVAAQVKSGAITREQAKTQLQEWAKSNPRPAKAS